MKAVVVGVALLFAVARFFVPHGPAPSLPGTYQAFAHLFVGGLFGGWLARRDRNWLWWLAAGLTGVEVAAFAAGRLL